MSTSVEDKLVQMDRKLDSKWRYIFIHGVLFFGLPIWSIGVARRYFFGHDQHLLTNSIIYLPIALAFGFAYGYWQWRFPFWRTRWFRWILKHTHPGDK